MTGLEPFADRAGSVEIGGLTIENAASRLSLYGSLDLTRDRAGLALALRLKAVLDDAVAVLRSDPALPDALPPKPPGRARNPFA